MGNNNSKNCTKYTLTIYAISQDVINENCNGWHHTYYGIYDVFIKEIENIENAREEIRSTIARLYKNYEDIEIVRRSITSCVNYITNEGLYKTYDNIVYYDKLSNNVYLHKYEKLTVTFDTFPSLSL